MTILSYPNHPAGSDIKSIENILANFDAVVTWANGNIDDTNLKSPMAAKRQLLMQASARISAFPSGDFLCGNLGFINNGSDATGVSGVHLWMGDSGYSAQPVDFVVPNKSSFCRIRVALATNGIAAGANIVLQLYRITAVSGTGGVVNTTGTVVAGTAATFVTPIGGTVLGAESAQFTMPSDGASYCLGMQLAAGLASGFGASLTMQLYGYNA